MTKRGELETPLENVEVSHRRNRYLLLDCLLFGNKLCLGNIDPISKDVPFFITISFDLENEITLSLFSYFDIETSISFFECLIIFPSFLLLKSIASVSS